MLDDLVLWEPLAPAPLDTQDPYSCYASGPGWSPQLVQQLMQQEQMMAGREPEAFSMCKSGIKEGECMGLVLNMDSH